MLIVLGVLAVGVVGVVLVWNYRRQAAAREAASAERMKAFLDQARAAAGRPAERPSPPPSVIEVSIAVSPTARQQPEVAGIALRAPLLNAEQRALHDLLKSALPHHDILACVSLAAFMTPAQNLSGFAREAQERRLADAVVDFLVCDKSMNPVAAVQCGARSGKAAGVAAFAAACVASHGLRWLEFTAQVAPGAEEIRRRVLGP